MRRIGSNNQSFFGDYSPTVRTLTDFNFRGITCQFEMGSELGKLKPFVGIRVKEEIPLGFGRSVEAVIGTRLHLEWPTIIKAFIQ